MILLSLFNCNEFASFYALHAIYKTFVSLSTAQ